jgi:hypothetical protein
MRDLVSWPEKRVVELRGRLVDEWCDGDRERQDAAMAHNDLIFAEIAERVRQANAAPSGVVVLPPRYKGVRDINIEGGTL